MIRRAHHRARRAARSRSALADISLGTCEIALATLTAPVSRRRYNRWGATASEVAAAMPGDELVPQPQLGYTRAISVDAPPSEVWRWLVQIGQGRGGLYSFDGLENLVRCDIHSTDRVLGEHQELRIGDLVRLGPDGYPCFMVARVVPPAELVLVAADPKPPHAAAIPPGARGGATWQWVLRSIDGGCRTRLITRQRLAYPRAQRVLWHVVEPVAFVMERQMLLGIKRRAERAVRLRAA